MSARPKPSIVSKRFDQIEVIEELGRDNHGNVFYRCLCDCGKYFVRPRYNIVRNKKKQTCPGCKLSTKKRLDQSRWPLVEENYSWVQRIIWRWVKKWPGEYDEILSAAHEGLVIAAIDFEESMGHDFQKWCYFRISKKVYQALFKIKRFDDFRKGIIEKAMMNNGTSIPSNYRRE